MGAPQNPIEPYPGEPQPRAVRLRILGGLIGLLWLIQCAHAGFFPNQFSPFGILPRTLPGLRGIFLAPLIHGSFSHLLGNTVPLGILGWFVLAEGISAFGFATLMAMLVGGVGTWWMGAQGSTHIGASGIIFGYLGFLAMGLLFRRACFPQKRKGIVLFLLVLLGALLYASRVGNPSRLSQAGVSLESHVFGFLGGAIAAYGHHYRPRAPSSSSLP